MASAPIDIAELELSELEGALDARGVPRFHARQIYRWIHQRGVTEFAGMTDLSRTLRATLSEAFTVSSPRVVSDELSADGTRKPLGLLSLETIFRLDRPKPKDQRRHRGRDQIGRAHV